MNLDLFLSIYDLYNLAHPFVDRYHDPMDEPTTQPVFDEHDGQQYSVLKWKCKYSRY